MTDPMTWGHFIQAMAGRVSGVVSALLMGLVVFLSPLGVADTHDADHPVATVAVQTQAQGFAPCHSQLSCASFVAAAGVNLSNPNDVRKAEFSVVGEAARTAFRPAFEAPPPRA